MTSCEKVLTSTIVLNQINQIYNLIIIAINHGFVLWKHSLYQKGTSLSDDHYTKLLVESHSLLGERGALMLTDVP